MPTKEIYIKVTKDGPYMVYGLKTLSEKVILTDSNGISVQYGEGESFEIKTDPIALCRCGHSKHAPFCDSAHLGGFKGTETASFDDILKNAERIDGKNLTLMDNEKFCAFARFCDAKGRIWNLIQKGTKASDEEAIRQSHHCPAGRLMIFDKKGELIDENLPQEINPIHDNGLKIDGPLWVRGGIRVESSDGISYEVRNRQTLCRCGASTNKPFCNGAHAPLKFKAIKAK